ncbi:flavin reductase family protein [Cryobacterium sp. PH29-G1]|uniref:flavin reductase family protein n=1 Tax=Cryobacterium sp. PH29-G1 TaxID=3046211 RepID=UPI0024BA0BFE|nr:flavin reductase family protein [Cryobacterium sp. PH29-G1]MDJ0349596.1 flavin reductase family protein [Cryobacterium sp. PH29-G1]
MVLSAETATPFDTIDLRNTLGKFATGVTVITTRGADGRHVGITANSFTSVSLDPPLLLFCLANSSPILPVFETAEHFAIHVLAVDQHQLSRQFATPAIDKFSGLAVTEDDVGTPEIQDVLARFSCRTVSRTTEGDHTIFIGHVRSYKRLEGDPLVFFSGKYRVSQDHPAILPRRAEGAAGHVA